MENGAGGACSGTGRTGEGAEIGHTEQTGQSCVPSCCLEPRACERDQGRIRPIGEALGLSHEWLYRQTSGAGTRSWRECGPWTPHLKPTESETRGLRPSSLV